MSASCGAEVVDSREVEFSSVDDLEAFPLPLLRFAGIFVAGDAADLEKWVRVDGCKAVAM